MTTNTTATINFPEKYCSELIPTASPLCEATDLIPVVLNYIAMSRPLDDCPTEDYEYGRHLILEHLAKLTKYASEIQFNNSRHANKKIKLLENRLYDYKALNKLQAIIQDPDTYYEEYLVNQSLDDNEKTRKTFDITVMSDQIKRYNKLKAKLSVTNEPSNEVPPACDSAT